MHNSVKTADMHDLVTNDVPAYLRDARRSTADPAAAARALRPVIEAGAAKSEQMGYLDDTIVRGLAESGLLGLLVPREFGGIEADPDVYIDCIEQISYADGSTGWALMATSFGTSGLAILLGDEARKTVFNGNHGFVAAGQVAPLGKAVRVEGGYRVSGRFQFGSGSPMASWFYGAFVLQEDGQPVRNTNGQPQVVWCVAPRSRVTLLTESWDVAGLAATASYDFVFNEQVVSTEFEMTLGAHPRPIGPLYQIGVSIAHVSWALGVGMRVLDEIRDLAKSKRRPGRPTLVDQPTFQRDFATAAATLEGARASVRAAFRSWHLAAQKNEATLQTRMTARLASCWATEVCANIGRFAYLAAGSDGARNRENNRLQRAFRDLHVGCTHKHVDQSVLIDCGAVLLGVNDPKVEL
jgi:alkylation response protein AidB-like acyl-CoA dehydrogenase